MKGKTKSVIPYEKSFWRFLDSISTSLIYLGKFFHYTIRNLKQEKVMYLELEAILFINKYLTHTTNLNASVHAVKVSVC